MFAQRFQNAVNLGFALSFGVLFPELMEYFGETREQQVSNDFLGTNLDSYSPSCAITGYGITFCQLEWEIS